MTRPPCGACRLLTTGTCDRAIAIQAVVAERSGIAVGALRGRARTARLAFARHVAMTLVRRRLGCSYPEIGRSFGRDHTTVIYAVERMEDALAANPELAAFVVEIEAELDRNEAKRCA